MSARRYTSILIILCVSPGCEGRKLQEVVEKKQWPLDHVSTMPAEIVVESGTKFRCGGVPCQLLGVKESDDPALQKQAGIFTKTWFKSVGNYVGIYNDTNPLMTTDGTAVVWIRGYDTCLSCLSEELVRAGLVDLDESQLQTYTFTVPTKESEAVEDWLGILRKAKEGQKSGEELKVLFEWPPK